MLKNEKFDPERIMELAKAYSAPKNPLEYINDYNDQLSVSQVVRFFEKQGVSITKTMIQNYVRLGLMPAPLNKRYYTKEHFMILTMIIRLKDLYPLEVLRSVFAASPELSENTHIPNFYDAFLAMYREASQNLGKALPGILEGVKLEAEKTEADVDKQQMQLTLMALMVQSAVAKRIADSFVENYVW